MTQDLTPFVPEIWSKKLQVMLNKNTIYRQISTNKFEGEIKNYGDTVNIRVFPRVTTNAYTDTCIYDDVNPTLVPLLINQKSQFGFACDDVSKAQSDIDIIAGFLKEAKKSIEVDIDERLFSHTADVDAGNIIATSVLTKDNAYAKFLGLAKVLKSNNVSAKEKPYAIVNPDIEEILLQAPEFIQSGKLGEKTLSEGAIGMIGGLEIFVSNVMTDVAGTYSVFASYKENVALAIQVAMVEQVRDKGDFTTYVRGLTVFGSKLIKSTEAAVLTVTLS